MWHLLAIGILSIGSAALAVIFIVPLVHSERWWVRGWEFPRLQLAALSGLFALGWAVVLFIEPTTVGIVGFLVAVALVGGQVMYAMKYGPWTGKQMPSVLAKHEVDSIRVIAANLDARNTSFEFGQATLAKADADLLLLIEMNAEWDHALCDLRSRYPHRVERVAEDGVGLSLWSKPPLEDVEVRYLVNDDRPSIWATVWLPSGESFRWIGIHPVPPGLRVGRWYERFDSRMRDAELLSLAKQIQADRQADPNGRWIVAGDFNDVAWSRTTRAFERTSGLLDPRVGRKLLNTYHARHPWLRYPLDHVYASEHFGVVSLERLRLPGSDHFAMVADLGLLKAESEEPPSAVLPSDLRQRVAEGRNEGARTDDTTGVNRVIAAC